MQKTPNYKVELQQKILRIAHLNDSKTLQQLSLPVRRQLENVFGRLPYDFHSILILLLSISARKQNCTVSSGKGKKNKICTAVKKCWYEFALTLSCYKRGILEILQCSCGKSMDSTWKKHREPSVVHSASPRTQVHLTTEWGRQRVQVTPCVPQSHKGRIEFLPVVF